MVHKFGSEIEFADGHVLLVYEFFKIIGDKLLGLGEGHSGFGVGWVHGKSLRH
jgi:hypothetical protein